MKPIDQMTLQEIAEYMDNMEFEQRDRADPVGDICNRLRKLHDLTRWIDVYERRPVFADCNGLGGVETLYANVTGFAQIDENGTIWAESLITGDDLEPEIRAYKSHDYLPFTHWRRIILPWYKP